MYPVTNAVKALFDAENRQVLRITGIDKNGVPITITEKNVLEGGFNVDRYACNSERLEIGTAISAELTLRIDNRYGTYSDAQFEGTELFVEIGVADWSQPDPVIHYVPCGYFTPDEQPRALNTITINALDRMMRFEKELEQVGEPYKWVDGNGNPIVDESGNNIVFYPPVSDFPCTVASLVQQCCDQFGILLGDSLSGMPNSDYVINSIGESNNPVTYRNLIQWAAGIMGANAYIDWEGKLRFDFFNVDTGYVTTIENRFSSSLFENDVSISGITFTDTSDQIHLVGSDYYALDLTGNLLFNADNADALLTSLYTVLHAFTYRPFNASVVSAPYLWPMDRVVFVDKDDNGHVSSLTNVNITVNGTTSLAAKAETDRENSYAAQGAFTGRQAKELQKTVNEINNTLNEAVQSATDLITGANGGHVRFIYDASGELSEIVILGDSDDITTATKVWRWNEAGLGYSSNGYGGPYTTAITKDGSIVASFITTGILTANIIRAGILSDALGKNTINLDNGAVSMTGSFKTVSTMHPSGSPDVAVECGFDDGGVYLKGDNTLICKIGVGLDSAPKFYSTGGKSIDIWTNDINGDLASELTLFPNGDAMITSNNIVVADPNNPLANHYGWTGTFYAYDSSSGSRRVAVDVVKGIITSVS